MTAKMKEARTIRPTSFDDVESLVGSLIAKESIIVDLDGIPTVAAKRTLDFLCGAVFALGGTINRLKYKKYILIPRGIKINRIKNV